MSLQAYYTQAKALIDWIHTSEDLSRIHPSHYQVLAAIIHAQPHGHAHDLLRRLARIPAERDLEAGTALTDEEGQRLGFWLAALPAHDWRDIPLPPGIKDLACNLRAHFAGQAADAPVQPMQDTNGGMINWHLAKRHYGRIFRRDEALQAA